MGEWSMLDAVKAGFTAAYIAPLKAIVEEKTTVWSQEYPQLKIGLYTGDAGRHGSAPTDEQILLFTPEKLNAYLQGWKSNLSWISRLGVLVVDEFHFLGDRGRGAALEVLISRLRRINPFIRIVGLSATLSNDDELAKWLGAKVFRSEWRPINLERRITRFKKVSEKVGMLLDEVQQTVDAGGKVLVFVNSRKRAETIFRTLAEVGYRADFNHAGLSRERRGKTHDLMRAGDLDVLVATSTLEMGVNFPARKVVIFDAYAFDGESFAPLTVQRYLQFAGRAGRPGLDDSGEAVMFLPSWDAGRIDYLSASPEPVRSGLFATGALLKEVLCEVSGRLSISERHLETNFAARTFWRAQGGKLDLKQQLASLLKAGLMRRCGEGDEYLSVTSLGRVGTQMGVAPGTVILLANLFRTLQLVTTFDLLLACCLTDEATPRLGFNFEEIDDMADTILQVPSHLLDRPSKEVIALGDTLSEKRLLSAIKCATILHCLCQGDEEEDLAETYDAYPLDINILRKNAGWVLDTAQRLFAILQKQEMQQQGKDEGPPSQHEEVCHDLSRMLQYGIPWESLGLVEIEGIGPRRAQALVRHGITMPMDLLDEDEETLAKILRMRPATLEKILVSAEKAIEEDENRVGPFERDQYVWSGDGEAEPVKAWAFPVDPYRLRRALELKVDHKSSESVRVSGGTEPHLVQLETDRSRKVYRCDCHDFVKGTSLCKHIIRARLELCDDEEMLEALRALSARDNRALRHSIGDLWLKAGREYDHFNGRQVDYAGDRFLKRAKLQTEERR